jgi:hypothetical protein
MKLKLLLFLIFGVILTAVGQAKKEVISAQDSIYKSQVNKTRIDGIYIPKDVKEAMTELDRLSPEESKAKLKTISEDVMAKKLHFGLGRWVAVNWQLELGSRLSKHLDDLGLIDQDEKVNFLLKMYHRHLMGTPLLVKETAKEVADKRDEAYRKMMKEKYGLTIDTTKRTKKS